MKLLLMALALMVSCKKDTPPTQSQTPIVKHTITNGQIRISACEHDAGAICSLTFGGKEMIDDHDHGRQLQSASTFNGLEEGYNPTEAGASYLTDGVNPSPSSSELLEISTEDNVLYTKVKMAFWNPVNGVATSNHILEKWVSFKGMYIEYKTRFTVPDNESLFSGKFEVLTGYMPIEFDRFYKVNFDNGGALETLSSHSGEQKHPIIFANAAGTHAMGILTNHTQSYGRWRFNKEQVTKWNHVVRKNNPAGVHNFVSFVFVDSLPVVHDKMKFMRGL